MKLRIVLQLYLKQHSSRFRQIYCFKKIIYREVKNAETQKNILSLLNTYSRSIYSRLHNNKRNINASINEWGDSKIVGAIYVEYDVISRQYPKITIKIFK